MENSLDAGAVPAASTKSTPSSNKDIGNGCGVNRNTGVNPVGVLLMGVK